MEVAMVSEHASPLATLGGVDAGGQNVYVAALATAMAKSGASVTVYTRRDDESLPARVDVCPGVSVVHVDAGPPTSLPKDELLPHMAEFSHRLRKAWSEHQPAIVHAHFWMSGMASLAAARPLGIPVLQTFHALGIVKRRHQGAKDTSPAERLDIEARIMRDADRIVATCTDELFELVRMGADASRVHVVPCGVDLDVFRPDGPAEPRTRNLRRVVVVSRLVERKGIGNVISAISRVPRCELIVAGGPKPERLGDDPDVTRYRTLASRLGVPDRVHFTGSLPRDRVPALLRSADVVACAPWYEPFGIVPLEAMACGVPLIATAVGGLTDTVVDGVTGFHVPPRRPSEIARKLRWLLRDPELRRRMGAAGVERARSRYGWDIVAEQVLDAYQLVLGRSARLAARRARGEAG
jgi:glycosyltransferase involved in cell wall biosynthesis